MVDSRTVLLTGARGFTGQYMANLLRDRGYRVVNLVSRPSSEIDTVSCDLTNQTDVESAIGSMSFDYVVHLAGIAFVGHADDQAFYNVNLFGTQNLLEVINKQSIPPKKILIASSANIYGVPKEEILSENICPEPVNHYAMSKLAMEHMARTWFKRLPIIIARPFNYTGIGQNNDFLIPKIVKHFREKSPVIELGNLNVSRDFSDVRDVVEAYTLLLESDVHSEAVNVCSGRIVSLSEIVELLNNMAGYVIDVKVNPAYVRKDEIPVLCGSNILLKRITGFEQRYTFETTLRDMFCA